MSTSAQAVEALSQAFKADPGYAHSWHCNIAMAMLDSLDPEDIDYMAAHKACNEAASRFMKQAFDVDTLIDQSAGYKGIYQEEIGK